MSGVKNDMSGVKNVVFLYKNDIFGSVGGCTVLLEGGEGLPPPPPLWVPRGRDLGGGKTPHWKDYTRKQSWNSFPGKISGKMYKKSILEFILWKK